MTLITVIKRTKSQYSKNQYNHSSDNMPINIIVIIHNGNPDQVVAMSKYALLMIHKSMVGSGGNADELLKDVEMLNDPD